MSTRAIAPIVGVGHVTVSRDIEAATVPNETVSAHPRTVMRVDPDTGEVEDVPARKITGVNGKDYAVPYRRSQTGVTHETVAQDIDQGARNLAPEREPRRVVEVITADADTGEVIEDKPRKITGMDGNT